MIKDKVPSMTGKNNGFVAKITKKKVGEICNGQKLHHIRCIIHQVICSKLINMAYKIKPIKQTKNLTAD